MPASFLWDLCLVVVGALVGGALATRLRLPLIAGYLLCGVLIGPHGLGWIAEPGSIERLSGLGVALLMFALGLEVALDDLRPIARTAIGLGAIQILGTVLLVALGAQWAGVPARAALVLGAVLSLSSTALVLRVLAERGELESLHGRLLMAMLLVQDLAVLPMVLLMPLLATGTLSGQALAQLGLAAAFLLLSAVLGRRWASRLLRAIAAVGRPELFLLGVVGLCLALAGLAEGVGMGVALGAFLAGLVVRPSREGTQALANVRPLSDLFATVFFVSLGMRFDPQLAMAHPWAIASLLGAIIGLKGGLGALAAWTFGANGRTALGVGLGLAQTGEFSFVLAAMAQRARLLPAEPFAEVMAASVLSLLLAPFLIAAGRPVGAWLMRHPRWSFLMRERSLRLQRLEPATLSRHVVIAGYGRIGQRLGQELMRWGVPCLGLDLDLANLEALRQHGGHALYGDATRPEVLHHARLDKARMLFIALPDATSAELCLVEARKLAPELEIVVRAHRFEDLDGFYTLGANEVVQPEFEASLESIRRALVGFGFDPREVGMYLAQIRARHYVTLRGPLALDQGAMPPIGDVGLELRWMSVEPGAKALELPLFELEHPHLRGVALLAVRRRGRTLPVPGSVERLRAHDQLLVLAQPEVIRQVAQLLRGPAPRLAGGSETG